MEKLGLYLKFAACITIFISLCSLSNKVFGEADDVDSIKLVRVLNGYVVLYNNEKFGTIRTMEFKTIDEVKSVIGLFYSYTDNIPYAYRSRLTYSRIDAERNMYILKWKNENSEIENRLSFISLSEAEYFKDKLEHGAYSRSSYGHAIELQKI